MRPGLTLVWALALVLSFHWWDVTLRSPRLLVWTWAFLALFLATAAVVFGGGVRTRRREVWVPAGVWVALVLVANLAAVAFPAVPVEGRLVSADVYLPVLDLVLPIWMTARALALVWAGGAASAWPLAAVALPALALWAWSFMIRMPGRSHAGALPPLTAEQDAIRHDLEMHVRALAGTIGERNYARPAALARAVSYLRDALARLGYQVGVQPFAAGGETFSNVEVVIPGGSHGDEIVVVGGHYDSVEGSPGADDNASGSAAVLALARLLAAERPARTVRLVLFANEEPPFFESSGMGSRVYAAQAAQRGERIVAMFSLETIGHYADERGSQQYPFPFGLFYPDRGDFVAFVANLQSARLVRRSIGIFRRTTAFPSEGVAAPAWVPGISLSDHASFWRHGWPAVMITDTAPYRYPYYHSELDTPDKLDYARLARVVAGMARVVREVAARGP
jgi:peptidase M28-like protein